MWMWRKLNKARWRGKNNIHVKSIKRNTRKEAIEEVDNNKKNKVSRYICHIIRHNDFFKNIFEGKIGGNKARGRPRKR
jgi:hypothetical protein